MPRRAGPTKLALKRVDLVGLGICEDTLPGHLNRHDLNSCRELLLKKNLIGPKVRPALLMTIFADSLFPL